jgi:bacteriocin biosynthesis cyclodehydratase domain-containing protein
VTTSTAPTTATAGSASRNLRIKPQFSIVAHDPNTVELRSGVWNIRSYTLTDHAGTGRLYSLLRGLDGTVGRADLAKSAGVTRTELEALIDHLDQLGVLARGPENALDAYLETAGGLALDAPRPPVHVLGLDPLSDRVAEVIGRDLADVDVLPADAALPRALTTAEPTVLEDGLAFERFVEQFEPWRGSILIHAAETLQPWRLAVLNRVALALNLTWVQAAVDGPLAMIGPSFIPPGSPCFACFETRVMMNLRETAGYQRYKDALVRRAVNDGAPIAIEGLRTLVAGHVALEVLNIAVTGTTATAGKVLGIYLPTMEFAYSEVLRMPGCSSCGPVLAREATELYFDVRRWIDA